jgi:hypothetical protein
MILVRYHYYTTMIPEYTGMISSNTRSVFENWRTVERRDFGLLSICKRYAPLAIVEHTRRAHRLCRSFHRRPTLPRRPSSVRFGELLNL